jgi:hypothetical protein
MAHLGRKAAGWQKPISQPIADAQDPRQCHIERYQPLLPHVFRVFETNLPPFFDTLPGLLWLWRLAINLDVQPRQPEIRRLISST